MKKLLLTAFSFVLIFSSLSAGNKEKKNKVKSRIQYAIIYEKGKETNYKESYEEFNRNGKTVLKIDYKPDGAILYKESVTYDSYGNITEEVIIDNEKNKYSRLKFKYNSDNKKSEELEYDKSGNVIKKTVYNYNSSGERNVEVVFDGNGKVLKKVLNSYNGKGLRIERKTLNASDALESIKKSEYIYY